MLKEMTEEMKTTFIETSKVLKGHQRRLFMARVVNSLGRGGMSYGCKELGWSEETIRKGQNELRTGVECLDAVNLRGRKKTEEKLPNLRRDMKAIVDSQSQIDGTFQTERLYTRISAQEVRRQLIKAKGYQPEELPTAKTLGVKLNEMGYRLRGVTKSKPKKKIAETDAIFERLAELKEEVAGDKTVLRMSLDAKATVKIGEFSRNGKSRWDVKALDHDFQAVDMTTPYGIW